jgi:hypothetical protein
MPSPGVEADISISEAADLLLKLRTEAARVLVMFHGRAGMAAGVTGFILPGPIGFVVVKPSEEVEDPFFIFNPHVATSFKYAENCALPPSTLTGGSHLLSSLIFIYPDNSRVTIFEIDPANG